MGPRRVQFSVSVMSGWASGVGTCWGRGWSGGGSYLVRGAALGAITSLGRWGVGVKPNRPPGRRAEGFSSPTHPVPSLVREATPSLPTPPNAGLPGPPPSAYPVDNPHPFSSLARSLARRLAWSRLRLARARAPPPGLRSANSELKDGAATPNSAVVNCAECATLSRRGAFIARFVVELSLV